MEINLDQTKMMTTSGTRKLEVKLDGQEFEQVEEFVYLGGSVQQ